MKKKNYLKKSKMEWANLSSKSLVTFFKIATVFQCLFYKTFALALEQTTLVTGGKKLIADATTVALIIEAGLIVVLEVKTGIAYQSAEPEEKTKHKKEAKGILMVGVLIVCATSLIKVILGYFAPVGA